MSSARGDTARQLLVVAERMFADLGIETVSLRAIGDEAGQSNRSAVLYHFGSREGLVEAILDHRLRTVDDRRNTLLEAMAISGDGSLRSALMALVWPLVEELKDPESRYLGFLSHLYHYRANNSHPLTVVHHRALSNSAKTADRVTDLFRSHMAGVDEEIREHRIQMVGQLMVHSLADRERAVACGGAISPPVERLVPNLLDVSEAMLVCPVQG